MAESSTEPLASVARSAADRIARLLVVRGVRFVFTVPGGMIAPLLDALHRHEIQLVTVGHEQAASFAVDAIGRLSNAPAVALATVGPGALNLLTGITSAWLDSIPAVFLVGQVQSYLQRGDRPLRQRGFQEVEFTEVVAPVCKAIWKVARPADAEPALAAAFATAMEGRRGPVVIELPFDVQASPAAESGVARPHRVHPLSGSASLPPLTASDVTMIESHLARAARPLLLVGGGVRAARAEAAVVQLADILDAPVAMTLHVLDLLPWAHPRNAGMIGPYGHRSANHLVLESDLVLVLGSRLDHGHTGADVTAFRRGRRVIRVDIDRGELEHRVRGIDTVHADVAELLAALVPRCPRVARESWARRAGELREQYPVELELARAEDLNPHEVVRRLVDAFPAPGAIVVDLGQHTWWVSQAMRLHAGHRFIAATGLGCMGYALGAAVGIASLGWHTLVFVGDGAAQMTIQELETLRRMSANALIVVLDNQTHGMVREYQTEAFEGRAPASQLGYTAPDFERLATAWGIAARSVRRTHELDAAVAWAMEQPGLRLLRVVLDSEIPVRPSVAYGNSLARMAPPWS